MWHLDQRLSEGREGRVCAGLPGVAQREQHGQVGLFSSCGVVVVGKPSLLLCTHLFIVDVVWCSCPAVATWGTDKGWVMLRTIGNLRMTIRKTENLHLVPKQH